MTDQEPEPTGRCVAVCFEGADFDIIVYDDRDPLIFIEEFERVSRLRHVVERIEADLPPGTSTPNVITLIQAMALLRPPWPFRGRGATAVVARAVRFRDYLGTLQARTSLARSVTSAAPAEGPITVSPTRPAHIPRRLPHGDNEVATYLEVAITDTTALLDLLKSAATTYMLHHHVDLIDRLALASHLTGPEQYTTLCQLAAEAARLRNIDQREA